MKFDSHFLLLSLLLISSSAWTQTPSSTVVPEVVVEQKEPSCDEALDASIKKLIDADHNGILALQYNLTMLKLAKKVVASKSVSLEDYIKKDMARLNDLHAANPATLDRLQELYDQHAGSHIQSVFRNIQNLKQQSSSLNYITNKKISNDDVASYLMYDAILSGDRSSFDRPDVAIAWLMDKVKTRMKSIAASKSTGLEMSDQIARYAGLVWDVDGASAGEIEGQIRNTERKIDAFMKTARDAFMKLNPECLDLNNPNNGCYRKDDERYAELLLEMQGVGDVAAKRLAEEVRKGTRGVGKVKIGQEELHACEGKPYKPRELGFKRYEFQKPTIPNLVGGPVRCTVFDHHGHSTKVHSGKAIQIDFGKKETCCKNKITQYSETKIFVGMAWGLECRAHLGVPYVAELGIKGGLHAEVGGHGKSTLDERTCEAKNCLGLKVALRAELALYAEALAGLGSIEGGVAWEPWATGSLCMVGDHFKAKTEYKFGRAMVYYKASLGWGLAQKQGNAIIHEDYTMKELWSRALSM